MANSFTQLLYHLVFSTKDRKPWIQPAFRDELGEYIAGIISSRGVPLSKYVRNQAEHHRKRSFQEEYIGFLDRHGIPYDERYVWG